MGHTLIPRLIRIQIITAAILLIADGSYGQTVSDIRRTKNAIYLEAATFEFIGMYALNYERALLQKKNLYLAIDAGFGGWYLMTFPTSYYGLSVPLSLTVLLGPANNHIEIDIGARYTIYGDRSNNDRSPFFPVFNIGYRYQRADGKGLIFRSFIGYSGIGLGVGKAF
jgi:hypothetical protein